MMKFMEKIWGGLGIMEQDEGDAGEVLAGNDASDHKAPKKVATVVNLHAAQKQVKVVVIEPFSFDDAQHIADHLKNRKPVVINFENTEKDVAKRMVDFISGTTYALNGSIQKIGHDIFLCAPSNVDVAYCQREEKLDKSLLPWGK